MSSVVGMGRCPGQVENTVRLKWVEELSSRHSSAGLFVLCLYVFDAPRRRATLHSNKREAPNPAARWLAW
jgi:hypothetical protein